MCHTYLHLVFLKGKSEEVASDRDGGYVPDPCLYVIKPLLLVWMQEVEAKIFSWWVV